MSGPAALRGTILRLLELLGGRAAQIAYERDVPTAVVPAELICTWFDDQYHPTTPLFQKAFTPAERRILATFHRRFDAVVRVLPGGIEKVAELHARPEWGTVVQAAMDALGALGEDAN